jgi:ADP-heptose:LPS heptosyltransferase
LAELSGRASTVAVLRALQLGDLLCAIPALRALRAALPDAHITLIGLPWSAALPARYPAYIADVLLLPGYPGFPEQRFEPAALVQFLAEARARRFDLAIQLQGDGTHANSLVSSLGADRVAGFYCRDSACPDARWFFPYPDHLREPARHVALMEFLGAPSRGESLEFPLYDSDLEELAGAAPELETAGPYVCVHPGGRAKERRWDPAGFAAVADGLAGQGFTVVLTGTEVEMPVSRSVRALMRRSGIDLCGRTGLGTMAALLSRCRMLLCNDTGVSHLAAALGVPSVVVSTRSDPWRWAPAGSARHRLLLNEEGDGHPLEPKTVFRECLSVLARREQTVAA